MLKYRICFVYLNTENALIGDKEFEALSRKVDGSVNEIGTLQSKLDKVEARVVQLELRLSNQHPPSCDLQASFQSKVKGKSKKKTRIYTLTISRQFKRTDLENMSM